MTRLPKAPLIEVATQIRWGAWERGADGEFVRYTFTKEEEAGFPEVLERALGALGITQRDPLAPELEDVPFSISQRYRRNADSWPVYQSGLGVFSIHVNNDSYEWDVYKADVLHAIAMLTEALAVHYPDGVPFVGMELTYVDRFLLEEGERPDTFLKKKLALQYNVPSGFAGAPFIEKGLSSVSLSFSVSLNDPSGALTVGIDYVDFAGRPGYIMDTRVLSLGEQIEFTQTGISHWLDSAHIVQQHAFSTLIEPDYHRSFQ